MTLHLGWPQAILLLLLGGWLALMIAHHGKPRLGAHDAWHTLRSVAVVLLLLLWGGFFR